MKTVNFHPEAEAEMIAAAVYYEEQQADLGKRFLITVQEAVNNIRINPLLYQVVHLDVRRCLRVLLGARSSQTEEVGLQHVATACADAQISAGGFRVMRIQPDSAIPPGLMIKERAFCR